MRRLGSCVSLLAWATLAGCGDEARDGGRDVAADTAADAGGDAIDALDGADGDAGAADATNDAADVERDGDVLDDVPADQPPDDPLADPEPDPDLGPEIPEGPPVALLTINELPAAVNGSTPYFDHGDGPFEFTLVVPTFGFTLDLLADRPPAWLDPESLEVSCDAPFGGEDGIPAEVELAGEFEWTAERIRWLVPASFALAPEVTVSCTGRVANLDGEPSEPTTVRFQTRTMTPELHPFDPQDTWVVTFSRDRYDIALDLEGGGWDVVATELEDGDGEADFDEDLALLGLRGGETAEGAATVAARGVVGANAIVREWLIEETLRQVREHFHIDGASGLPVDEDSVNIRIYREGQAGAPDPVEFDGSFSIHGLGGDAPPDEPTQFGRASTIDERNPSAQDDGRLGYGSFTTSVARQVLLQPAGRFLLREILPGQGVPIGESPYDAEILADGFDPEAAEAVPRRRYRQIELLMSFFTKALASLVAHEIGHSLGLVACGPPPQGLFGGVYDDNWMESDVGCAHIDIAGLNIMQTGGALLDNAQDIQGAVAFEPLSLAYLRGRIILVP